MGSHIVRVKTVGDLKKALVPFADTCPITTIDIKYMYENEGRLYLSASQDVELAATTANIRSDEICNDIIEVLLNETGILRHCDSNRVIEIKELIKSVIDCKLSHLR